MRNLFNTIIGIESDSGTPGGIVPLTLTAEQANSSVKLTKSGSPTVNGLQYRLGTKGPWTQYTIDTLINLANIGDCVQFQNVENNLSINSSSSYVKFVMTGKIAGSGSIQSMLNYADTLTNYCYYNLFRDCKSLTTAPELPATNLANNCYFKLFQNCSGLTTPPELPATNLTNYCYTSMFENCTGLTTAPELPATNLAENCYYTMFKGCLNLTTPPKLPATNLALYCYYAMFENCRSLTTAPELPATNLARFCYYAMFTGCSSLNYIKVNFTEWHNDACTAWVTNVSKTGIFECPDSLHLEYDGSNRIPIGWDVPNRRGEISAEDQSYKWRENNNFNYQLKYSILPQRQRTIRIIDGTLPAGLSLDSSTGVISGITNEVSNRTLRIEFSAENSNTVVINFNLEILAEDSPLLPEDSIVLYVDGTSTTKANTGQTLTKSSYGTVEATKLPADENINVLNFSEACLYGPPDGFPFDDTDRCISVWSQGIDNLPMRLLSYGYNTTYKCYQFSVLADGKLEIRGKKDYADRSYVTPEGCDKLKFNHFLINRKSNTEYFYINGVLVGEYSSKRQTGDYASSKFVVGGDLDYANSQDLAARGYLTGIRVFNRALTNGEINALSKEFVIVELPEDYLTVNGTDIYEKVITGENTQDNYPVKFVKWISNNQGILGGGSFVFNTKENRWQQIGDLNPDDPANIMYQAKTAGVNGLTGEWETVNGTGEITVEYNGTLPEWNGTPDTGDKEYKYKVTTTSTDYADAAGDYYEITGAELDALYPQNNWPLANGTGPYYTNGGPYYLSYDKDTQTCFLNRYFNVPEFTGWDTVSTTWAMGVDLPATGEWTNGFEVVAYSGGGDGGDKEYVYTASGAGEAIVNGNYYETGEYVTCTVGDGAAISTPLAVYTNGTAYMIPNNGVNRWLFATTYPQSGPPLYEGPGHWQTNYMPDGGTWTNANGNYPPPTVTKYVG